MPPDADLVVVGAGSAGLSVAAGAAQLGLATVLIERHRMGGDCLNTGCVPSKALLAAARAAEAARRAHRLGVTATVTVEWDAVRRHVRDTIAAIAPADSQERFEALGARVIRGQARFAGPDAIVVDGEVIRARRIVIAAGSRPVLPDIPGLATAGAVTHETLFDIPRPDHLVIVGGGAIALEMGFAHAALGCRVTIVARGRLGSREDPELVDVLRTALGRVGVTVIEHARIVAAGPCVLHLADGATLAGTILVAAGRTPNTEDLDLPAGGVAAGPRGIATDRGLRSVSNRRVFAVGDIADPAGIGPRYLTHAASHGAGVVIRRAVFRLPAGLRTTLPRAIYTDPELAQTGLTEAEAREAGLNPRVVRAPYAENDRARAEGRPEGLVKLVLDRRGRLLGAGIAGPDAGEAISLWTLALDRRIGLAALADLIVPYPTLAEAGKRAAATPLTARLFAPGPRRLVRLLRHLP